MEPEELRRKIIEYGLSFPDTYRDAPFRDENWQLVRIKSNLFFTWLAKGAWSYVIGK